MFSAVAGLEIIGLAKSRLSPSGQIDGPASLCNGKQDANRKFKTEMCLWRLSPMSMIISSQAFAGRKNRQKAKGKKYQNALLYDRIYLINIIMIINTAKYRQTYFLWILSEGKSRMEEERS